MYCTTPTEQHTATDAVQILISQTPSYNTTVPTRNLMRINMLEDVIRYPMVSFGHRHSKHMVPCAVMSW